MATDPLRERLLTLGWPAPLLDRPDPEAGQLWRASWEGTAALVVVVGMEGRTVRALAAAPEHEGDESAVLVDTQNGMCLTVWAGIETGIKTFTLDHRISDLTAWSVQEIRSLRASGGAWSAVTDPENNRALVRAELLDDMDALSEAEWLPQNQSDGLSFNELAAQRNLKASDLARALGTTPGDASRLLQGLRETTPEEQATIVPLLGVVPSFNVNYDQEMLAILDLPEFRPELESQAFRHFGGDGVAARRSVAEQQMAMAARHREPGSRNWRALIREALRED